MPPKPLGCPPRTEGMEQILAAKVATATVHFFRTEDEDLQTNGEIVELTCPHCGSAVIKDYSWVMTRFSTRCTTCKTHFLIDRAYLLHQAQKLEAALTELRARSLSKAARTD
jgi:transposase-like protein